jgi:hypothetical protein
VRQSLASELDEISSASFVAGLSGLSVAEVRERRDRAVRSENLLSYVRRTLQARIDLFQATATVGNQPHEDVTTEVVRVLGDRAPHGGGSSARFVEVEIDSEDRADAESWLASVMATDSPGHVTVDSLISAERGISSTRAKLHGVIEVLSTEMVSRYKSGDATVESLLEQRNE